ncbi:hypothetical protein CISG_01323 [Coccidioides immitis RMSCC 3703]|uniref:Uncharacterized protein n=1 Tax=Coccidioides immitis RMSCC 3703 TaxID=454286 RepID=A0A0J8QZV8_COCIT|nr:hypothetical protein CISG_01323 [Coccidioides immitis RMSCC 3703]
MDILVSFHRDKKANPGVIAVTPYYLSPSLDHEVKQNLLGQRKYENQWTTIPFNPNREP